MPEPVTLALGAAIVKLLFRSNGLNDTADALGDTQSLLAAVRSLVSTGRSGPVEEAVSRLLEGRLAGVRDPDRREQMKIAAGNAAVVLNGLTDRDVAAAARNPGAFTISLLADEGGQLLRYTEEVVTPFTRQLMTAGAEVFSELAPRSPRFKIGALLTLLEEVSALTSGMGAVHDEVVAARDTLANLSAQVHALHPKADATLAGLERANRSIDGLLDGIPTFAAAVVAASLTATLDDKTVGPTIDQWEPARLGVHASITVHDETTLTPYIPRAHDEQLREVLREQATTATAALVLVVGTSCTGKTRTLLQAVRDVTPGWSLTAPKGVTELRRVLAGGVAARTVVWLDEVQKYLTATNEGLDVTAAITEILNLDGVGPLVFAGTIWSTNLTAMTQRPDPARSIAGADAIPDLLKQATIIEVPEVFSDTDLHNVPDDPRVRTAITTSSTSEHPEKGRKLTQVLAGGTQLVNRLHPPGDATVPSPFTPAAKAILLAAGDLHRVGMANPLPRWALEGAAPSYLTPPTHRPRDTWLTTGLNEATHAATQDDPITGTHTLDIHTHGIPALIPTWTSTLDGTPIEAYHLHDYLAQDHQTRYRYTPTPQALWDTLVTHTHHLNDDRAEAISKDAERRGLLTPAIDIRRPHTGVNGFAAVQLCELLAQRGDDASMTELRALEDAGNLFATPWITTLLVERGDSASIAELKMRADGGERLSQRGLADLLVDRGDDASIRELKTRADDGDLSAQDRLAMLLEQRGDEDSLRQLRARADGDDSPAEDILVSLLVSRGDETSIKEVLARADRGNGLAQGWCSGRLHFPLIDLAPRLRVPVDLDSPWATQDSFTNGTGSWQSALNLLMRRVDAGPVRRLRAKPGTGNSQDQGGKVFWLAERGDEASIEELGARAAVGDRSAQDWCAGRRAWPENEWVELELLSDADSGGEVAQSLLARVLEERGDADSIKELRARADSGDRYAQERLFTVLAGQGDEASLDEMRHRTFAGQGGLHLLRFFRTRAPDDQVRELDVACNPVIDTPIN